MHFSEERKRLIKVELQFSATRSSGPGGQNVNKVNTQVELRFSLFASQNFSDSEKNKIQVKLKNRMNSEGEIVLVSSVERSQWRNKERVIEKFFNLVKKALTPVKKRIRTKPSKASKLKRLESKKIQANKKQLRKTPEI